MKKFKDGFPNRCKDKLVTKKIKIFLRLPRLLRYDETKDVRSFLGITQQELADRMGVTRKTINTWETGKKRISPTHNHILRWFARVALPMSVKDKFVFDRVITERGA